MTGLISVDDAIALIVKHRPQMPAETVRLEDAHGRILASPLKAKLTQPPAALSAMDGYAVHLADVSKPGKTLSVIGEAPAGSPFQGTVKRGQAVRIFTGGHVPAGADHIVIQEAVSRDGDRVICNDAYGEPRHIRAAGRDFSEGDTLIEAGKQLGAADIAVAAASNHAELSVKRQPKVAIITNGNELRPPGSDLLSGEIVNSNPYGLGVLAKNWGGNLLQSGHAPDSIDGILDVLSTVSDADILVPVGGASVGDHDHMREAFQQSGFERIFEKVAVRPGKPTWFSRRDHQLVLGLPGNPASAFVCAHLFLRALMGVTDQLETTVARVTNTVSANGPRETFLRATTQIDDAGYLSIAAAPDQDSSLMTPFISANALIRRVPGATVTKIGEGVEFVPLSPI